MSDVVGRLGFLEKNKTYIDLLNAMILPLGLVSASMLLVESVVEDNNEFALLLGRTKASFGVVVAVVVGFLVGGDTELRKP